MTPDDPTVRARSIVTDIIDHLHDIERAAMVAGDASTIEALRNRTTNEYRHRHGDGAADEHVLHDELERAMLDTQTDIETPQDQVIQLMYWAFLRLEEHQEETVRILRQAVAITESMTGTRSNVDHEDDPEDDLLFVCYARHFLRWGADLEAVADELYWAGERARERAEEKR